MSNTNGSMDYRGFNISGGTDTSGNPNIPLPDPFDTINVETLNIVDNQNQPFYTMPREIPDVGGSVAVFESDGSSSLKPYASYPANPACFGWHDSGAGIMPPNTIITDILIPSFIQTGGLPQINSPIVNFTYDIPTGIITCNQTGVYLICQSYDVMNASSPRQFGWVIGLRNRTSGRLYVGARKNGTFSDPNAGFEFSYEQTTYDTFTAGTQLNFFGENTDPINSIGYRNIFLTIFRLA
jgi:hypothetical protein